MRWTINLTYVLCLFLYIGLEIYHVRAVKIDCKIPRRAWFQRSMYRRRSGSTKNYPAGSRVSHGTEIVAICKKDVYGDLITGWTVTQCIDGKWIPDLPSCKVKRRCQAPPEIKHAKPSDTVTPYKTFPHGSVLTYKCDVGKMATGNGTTVCDNGRWTDTGFTCEETTTPNLTQDNSLNELCSRLTINNGQAFVKDASNGIYDVKCDKGYKLAFDKVYKCTDGKWIGKEPECRKVAAKCQFPPALRARSIFRRKGTREVIYTMFVDHWTQAVQTCKTKSRGESSRIVKCVNGRWRPSLMPCRRKHDRVAIIKDTTPRVAETTPTTSTVKPSLVRTKIVKPPADQKVVRGSMAKFDCNVIHDPNVRVTWSWRHSRLGSEISSNSRVRMNPDGTLVMYSIRPEDAGNYTCVVTSSTGNDTRTATLKVIELPQAPFITSIQINSEYKRAASVKWIPGFDGNTPVKKFTLQYKEVRAKSGLDGWVSFDSDIPPTARETMVTGLLPGKRYQFRVFASNEVGDGPPSSPRPIPAIQIPNENDQETVITDTKPKVAETTKTTSILKQNDQVMVTTDTIPKAYETTTNSTAVPNDRVAIIKDTTHGVAETTSRTSTVKPSLVKTKIFKPPADQKVVRGSMAKFDCNVIHDPNVRVTWSWRRSRLGSEISSDSRVRMNPDGTLVMYSIRPEDAGNYTCVVTSSTGNDTKTATLKVIELPQAPFITSIQINSEFKRAASVKWIPGFDGNTPVKKFTLQYKEVRAKSGLDGWVSFDSDIQPTARETMVTGLLPGKRYQFRVFASNEVGDGPPSSPRPIPAIQIPDENGQETVITDTTPKVAETTKTTSILKQNDQVMVTTDTIPKSDETTTNSTAEPSTEYRVHVQVTQGAELPAYIVLDGNENRGVELALISPENLGVLSVFTVKGINVGEIEKISTSSTNNTDVNFVSIHNPDVSGFYIQRFENFDPGRPQEIMGKPCKRQYGEDLDTLPLYCSGKGKDFSNVKDIIDCKLLCIEEQDFTCKVAYYHKGHHTCYALEKYDTNCYINVSGSGKDAIFLFKRADTC